MKLVAAFRPAVARLAVLLAAVLVQMPCRRIAVVTALAAPVAAVMRQAVAVRAATARFPAAVAEAQV
jgi:hypothetical protein